MKISMSYLDAEVAKLARTYAKGSPERDLLEWAAKSLRSQRKVAGHGASADELKFLERLYRLEDPR